jgi:hypothetical protein
LADAARGYGHGQEPRVTSRNKPHLAIYVTAWARREPTAHPETGELPFMGTEWQGIKTMCERNYTSRLA